MNRKLDWAVKDDEENIGMKRSISWHPRNVCNVVICL